MKGRTIGMVGVGQVGSRIARTCEILGMEVLLNDPPRERAEGPALFVSLEEIRQRADIISFHVPLNLEGRDRTWHMVDADFCAGLAKQPLLINTCRGEVFDTLALHDALNAQQLSGLILDCWENEPGIDLDLLDRVDFGTPHIAGYSKDGKAKGTQTAVRAVSRFFGLGIDDWAPSAVEPPADPVIELDGTGQGEESIVAAAVMATYDIESDDAALRRNPQWFERLRGDYPVRREFDSHTIRARNVGSETIRKLKQLGFKT